MLTLFLYNSSLKCKNYLHYILQITIESDSDLRCALNAFAEMSATNGPVEFRSLHAQECIEIILDRDDHSEPLVRPSVVTSTTTKQEW